MIKLALAVLNLSVLLPDIVFIVVIIVIVNIIFGGTALSLREGPQKNSCCHLLAVLTLPVLKTSTILTFFKHLSFIVTNFLS
jgi:hypothetical protein